MVNRTSKVDERLTYDPFTQPTRNNDWAKSITYKLEEYITTYLVIFTLRQDIYNLILQAEYKVCGWRRGEVEEAIIESNKLAIVNEDTAGKVTSIIAFGISPVKKP
ncbi:hypothetical protein TESG_08393 [Trichophyton tonsurans CBS 112818]|uniref:Uncharacterized protein n=1 Tax=Trichophyton tonsurans (strain CBS 112818) TaxID=647933 RepID=F2RW99_TRIT1|nr:hypothetical protein TESG_08393 [Trichophyton tonsurans CBS 112818]